VNDTKVISAQLSGRRIGRGVEPKIEATLIKRLDGARWQALVKPAKRLAEGDIVRFGSEGRVCLLGHLDAEVEHKGNDGAVSAVCESPDHRDERAELGAARVAPGSRACEHAAPKCDGNTLTFCAAGRRFHVSCPELGLGACDPDAHGVDAACAPAARGPAPPSPP